MKTTINITDDLLLRAKRLARRRGKTLRALVEDGLREMLKREGRSVPRRVRPVVFGKGGLTAEFRDTPWPIIRDTIYRDRG
ncbi:MAG TPA: type II toxin-antitoxin system VapB family antitoxin [Vineibacter sp.]|nr:type II toxin-antitoxin system VapB family antitoxin [Vineibacter sp.]